MRLVDNMKYIYYMKKPYDSKSYNCWSFVKDFYKKEFDIELNELQVTGDDDSNYIYEIYKQESTNWNQIKAPKKHCVLALSNEYPIVDHVGIYLGDNKFIHNTQKAGVHISKMNDVIWKHKIVGCYEYRK